MALHSPHQGRNPHRHPRKREIGGVKIEIKTGDARSGLLACQFTTPDAHRHREKLTMLF
jgi:hypothetical protein